MAQQLDRDQAKRQLLYANLMHEVKIRIEAINQAVQGHLRLHELFIREFCWLQLRMLCELVSLSCLVAHGDITFLQPHKVGRSTSADEILDRMTKLRAHFYPFPVRQKEISHPSGQRHFEMEGMAPGPLPKEDLLKLYGRTHRHLHRGSLKGLLSMDINSPIDVTINTPEIVGWAQKINDQLSHHVIAISSERLMICVLRNASDNNKVQVATADAGTVPDLLDQPSAPGS